MVVTDMRISFRRVYVNYGCILKFRSPFLYSELALRLLVIPSALYISTGIASASGALID